MTNPVSPVETATPYRIPDPVQRYDIPVPTLYFDKSHGFANTGEITYDPI